MTSLNVAYGAQILAAAQRVDLDPTLLAAVAAQETGGPGASSGRNVVGDGGHGHGLFQIDDRWHAFAKSDKALDPAANADYAAGMLAGLLKKYAGNVHKALSAYNAGSPTARGTTTDWGDGKPIGYADSVARHYALLQSASGSPVALQRSTVALDVADAPPVATTPAPITDQNAMQTFAASLAMSGSGSPVIPQQKQHAHPAQSSDHFLASSSAADDDDDT